MFACPVHSYINHLTLPMESMNRKSRDLKVIVFGSFNALLVQSCLHSIVIFIWVFIVHGVNINTST